MSPTTWNFLWSALTYDYEGTHDYHIEFLGQSLSFMQFLPFGFIEQLSVHPIEPMSILILDFS